MRSIAVIIIAVLFSATSFAQKTDFSGTWTFKNQESISGTLYGNGVPKEIKIEQDKKTISFEKVTADAQGEDVTSAEKCTFDSKPFETKTSSGRKKSVVVKWNKDELMANSDVYSLDDDKKVEIKYTDRYTIEDDNLILIRKADNQDNGEVWESKSVYTK